MGDRKSEAGSRVEGAAKKADTTPIILLLQHSSAPDFWLLGSLAPPLGPDALWERSRFLSTWEESLETNNSDQGKL
jgi:hypothetical protein